MRKITALAALLLCLCQPTASKADSFTDGLSKHGSSLRKWAAQKKKSYIVSEKQAAATKLWLKQELGLSASSDIALYADKKTGSAIQKGAISGVIYTGAPMLQDGQKDYFIGINFQLDTRPKVEKRVLFANGRLTLDLKVAAHMLSEISKKSATRVLAIAGILDDKRIFFVTLALEKPKRSGKGEVYQAYEGYQPTLWMTDSNGQFKAMRMEMFLHLRDGGTRSVSGESGYISLPHENGYPGKYIYVPAGGKPIGLTLFE